MAKKKKVKKKTKIKFKNVLSFFITTLLLIGLVFLILSFRIKTITISGNSLYSDWDIVKIAGLNDYPSSIKTSSLSIKKKLESSPYIKKANVTKFLFSKVSIVIEENLPIFYYVPKQKTVLEDKSVVKKRFAVPTLINYVPDKLYDNFIKKMNDIDYDIIMRMSEIKYDPNDVDTERFLVTMNDGNYVYLTLSKFTKINNYVDIIEKFNNKKGILYLDSGEYFKILDGGE